MAWMGDECGVVFLFAECHHEYMSKTLCKHLLPFHILPPDQMRKKKYNRKLEETEKRLAKMIELQDSLAETLIRTAQTL